MEGVSSILRVLADTPTAALEEELRRLEHEQLASSDHLRADYLAIGRVRELAERRRRRQQELSMFNDSSTDRPSTPSTAASPAR